MILDIVEFDEEALRQETEEVEIPPSGEVKLLAAQMLATMDAADGLGLAAPQVNRSERLFVVNLWGKYHVFINPVIERFSKDVGTEEEACLSLPGVFAKVRRPKMVWITYYDAAGKLYESRKFKRRDARVIQHEMDHLDGKLIVDYVSDFEFGE